MNKRQTAHGRDGRSRVQTSPSHREAFSCEVAASSCERPVPTAPDGSTGKHAQPRSLSAAERVECPSTPAYVIGIDPGLGITGYAVLGCSEPRVLEAGVIRGGRGALADRLQSIYQGLYELLGQYQPAELALEELYSHYQRPRTAILMGHARGVICLAAAMLKVPVFPYAATHVKRAITGSGRSPKGQMQQAICCQLRLSAPPRPADVADALAIALCHYHMRRRPNVLAIGGKRQLEIAAPNGVEKKNASADGFVPAHLCDARNNAGRRVARKV